jgi:hypothetical protein
MSGERGCGNWSVRCNYVVVYKGVEWMTSDGEVDIELAALSLASAAK